MDVLHVRARACAFVCRLVTRDSTVSCYREAYVAHDVSLPGHHRGRRPRGEDVTAWLWLWGYSGAALLSDWTDETLATSGVRVWDVSLSSQKTERDPPVTWTCGVSLVVSAVSRGSRDEVEKAEADRKVTVR